jgi:hypothetical protein
MSYTINVAASHYAEDVVDRENLSLAGPISYQFWSWGIRAIRDQNQMWFDF